MGTRGVWGSGGRDRDCPPSNSRLVAELGGEDYAASPALLQPHHVPGHRPWGRLPEMPSAECFLPKVDFEALGCGSSANILESLESQSLLILC